MNTIKRFYKRRNQRLADRGITTRFDYSRPSEDYDWITINGVHTPIDDGGNIAGGAGGKFNGKKYTGSKMQRSKKRQEKVGGSKQSSFKLDKSKIKSKGLSKAVAQYAKNHDGQLPDQDAMHELSYNNFGSVKLKVRKIQNDYNKKYGSFSPTVNQAEAAERLEDRLKTTEKMRDTFERGDPEWERWDNMLQNGKDRLKEYYEDPDYEKHKKDWDKLKTVNEMYSTAMNDAKEFMVNKGRGFKTAEEAGTWMELSGWVKNSSSDDDSPKTIGKYPDVNISRMDTKFAGALAETIGTFQKDFPKMKEVVTGIALRGMDFGDMGGYDPGTYGVELASAYFSLDSISHGREVYEKRVKEGHFPEGTTVESVGHHEFTHAMEGAMKQYDFRFGKNVLGSKRPADIVLERVCKKLNIMPVEAKVKVSGYASRDYPMHPEYENTEFLAEAMSEAYTSPNPRPVAKAVREEFEKLYHEVYD